MSAANPLPTGSDLDLRRQSKEPPSTPALPGLWTASTVRPYFEWDSIGSNWVFKDCLQPNPLGLPYPDWID
jgi:hypothetical protein